MIKRIGFACKWSEIDAKKGELIAVPEFNSKTTTVAWLNRQTKQAAEDKLWQLTQHNLAAVHKLVCKIGEQNEHLRMVRLGSDILPVYTEPTWSYFWRDPSVQAYVESRFARVGELARSLDVRLSFHPGQFTVLASDNPDIVSRSIEEFEYHVDMIRYMGFGREFQDFKCNVHIAGRQGPDGIRAVYNKLSPEARNTITIENEEISYGLNHCLTLRDIVPIVLDIHHHWVREGEYISPSDPRVQMVIESWRGVRPTLHFSTSRKMDLVDHVRDVKPDLNALLESGHKKQKLRAHSDYMWNKSVNQWAQEFWNDFDIMVESKAKNLASFALLEEFTQQLS